MKEVGGPSFFALLVIAVSFLPVLTLEAQEGRLFKPLAYTKNFAMVVAAVLAITLDPAMRMLFARMETSASARAGWPDRQRRAGRQDPLGGAAPHQPRPDAALRAGGRLEPALEVAGHRAARWRWWRITVPVYLRLGSEFMPPLDEGTLLFMPTTLPGISVAEAQTPAAGAGPDPDAASPKWSACSARRAAPKPPPIPAPLLHDGDHRQLKPKSSGARATWYDGGPSG